MNEQEISRTACGKYVHTTDVLLRLVEEAIKSKEDGVLAPVCSFAKQAAFSVYSLDRSSKVRQDVDKLLYDLYRSPEQEQAALDCAIMNAVDLLVLIRYEAARDAIVAVEAAETGDEMDAEVEAMERFVVCLDSKLAHLQSLAGNREFLTDPEIFTPSQSQDTDTEDERLQRLVDELDHIDLAILDALYGHGHSSRASMISQDHCLKLAGYTGSKGRFSNLRSLGLVVIEPKRGTFLSCDGVEICRKRRAEKGLNSTHTQHASNARLSGVR
ncbi:MAG: hypothetical protein AAF802_01715 [Planctomycetota bacterium]